RRTRACLACHGFDTPRHAVATASGLRVGTARGEKSGCYAVASTALVEVVRRSATTMVVATSDSTPHTTSAATALPLAAISPANADEVGSAAPIEASQPGTVEISPVATATTPMSALTQ